MWVNKETLGGVELIKGLYLGYLGTNKRLGFRDLTLKDKHTSLLLKS
jgi:hypothetical protein